MFDRLRHKISNKRAIKKCSIKINACKTWSCCPLKGGHSCLRDRNLFESDWHYENIIISPSKVHNKEFEVIAKSFYEGFELGLKEAARK